MSDKTHIEWTDATWNPVTGCSKVSSGCKHCYAERDWARLAANPATRYHGRAFTDVRCHPDVLDLPLRWRRPRRIFVNSMADLFHEAVPDWFVVLVFHTMAWAHQHTFQVLTKRPERMQRLLSDPDFYEQVIDNGDECADWPWPLRNVWLGVSVEDQATADARIPLLLRTHAAVRWISAEPLLGPLDFEGMFASDNPMDGTNALEALDWVVAGGESGPQARPMHPAWARTLRDQCAAAGIPFLFKQWGEWIPRSSCYHTFEDGRSCADIDPSCDKWPNVIRLTEFGGDGSRLEDIDGGDDAYMQRVGKKLAGRLLDGKLHDGYPSAA